ncbi:MAG: bifunctional diguanylate cyclase/phosphodiesterase [Eubacteriales bacterium]
MENQWKLILENHKNPCFVADPITNLLLYVNNEYMKLLPPGEEAVGRKFFEVIENENAVESEDIILDWSNQEVIRRKVDNRRLNLSFIAELTFLQGEKVIIGILIASKSSETVISAFESAMSKCMDIYSGASDFVLPSFMELLCDFYGAECSHVCQYDHRTKTLTSVSQWCDTHASCESKGSDKHLGKNKIDASCFMDWLQKEEKNGILMLDSQGTHYPKGSAQENILTCFQAKNLTLAIIENTQGKILGIVVLSDRKHFSPVFDSRLLVTISHFVAQDVTKTAIDSSLFALHHRDPLTGLLNRSAYAKEMEKIKESSPKTIGVISVNINGLKGINTAYGNEVGDNQVKKSANKVKSHFGFTIFRMSGDEFIGFSYDCQKEALEKQVFSLLNQMRLEENVDFSLGYSFGEGNFEIEALLREADVLMYINKQEFYANKREFQGMKDNILTELLTYLQNDEFMIYLQPQVKLKDGSLAGAEALIRRFDKTNQKMVFPDQFISMYEQNLVIRHLDLFVVEQVCILLALWKKEGKEIPISVNLSRVTLQEYGIVDLIMEICDRYQVPHHLLVIEVTERVGLLENNVASALVLAFKTNGFNISLDDFGCAYSNIVTLAQIDVDEVKIDKSLVDELTTNEKNHILVKNVLTMCNELEGASTLAEGIENEAQAKLLYELGCHLGQGYYYARPMPVNDFVLKYLKNT